MSTAPTTAPASTPASTPYDLIIIGAGPGGYVAAERAGAMGKSVLIIEKSFLGGTCLNVGCIPSKTLLNSSKMYAHAAHGKAFGVETSEVKFNLDTVMKRKTKIIETLRKGIAFQMKRFKVDVVEGSASFVDRSTVKVGETMYTGKNIMIATGSSPIRPPIPGADQAHVVDSTGVLSIDKLPKQVVVIGGGVIGMEFASFFGHIDIPVTVIEMLPEILPNFEPELAKMLRKELPNVTCNTGCKVESIGADSVTFSRDGKQESVPADLVLMSIGRSPNVKGLNLEGIGVEFDPRKGIRVDDQLRTNIPGVYAVGDVNGRSQLAHSASRMGEVAVNTMVGHTDRMRYGTIPWVVYTTPEVAGVGMTEAQAKAAGHEVQTATWQLRNNGRFLAEHDKEAGFCKVIVDAKSHVLLGVHMIGGACSEMIFGAATMLETELRVDDIREIVFPHPTASESIRDAIFELSH